MAGRKGGTTEQGRALWHRGHDDALRFALLLGMDQDYKRDIRAKKDVVDPSGDAHSVKSGGKKWQIFLYRRTRFTTDDGFLALNGIGQLLVHCIDAFPPRYEDYRGNEAAAKLRLQTPMQELKDRFQRKALLRAFLKKSLFNGGEVDYLTVLHDGIYRVYWCDDVVKAMADGFTVENSKARTQDQYDDQKVVFKHDGKNVAELEMRNDKPPHYGEVRFNMNKTPALALLEGAITEAKTLHPEITAHGHAIKTFWKW